MRTRRETIDQLQREADEMWDMWHGRLPMPPSLTRQRCIERWEELSAEIRILHNEKTDGPRP